MNHRKKAAELVAQMTIEEVASQLLYNSPGITRLGIPAYNWWSEALHGVARAGIATVFPQAIGLAAMFDEEFLTRIADAIATEGRAKYNMCVQNEDRDIYKGINFWSPNINIFRDPRWGRGHETYGEDPYLTSRLGVAYINGLQQKDGPYMKGAACAKHFAAYSGPEDLRHSFNAEVSKKDLEETYLPAFEAAVKEAKVEVVMGAYNRINGEPCCGSETLLKDILRGKWEFDGHVTSDCLAIEDFEENHKVTKSPEESVALALTNGCDLNCGNIYNNLMSTLKEGLITEEQMREAATRLFTTRYRLGMFDENCSFNRIPYESNDCGEHRELNLEAGVKSIVMLKNDGILPLSKDKLKTVGVIGPTANIKSVLEGNYCGIASRYITNIEGIYKAVEKEDIRILSAEGCHIIKDRVEALAKENDRISEALTVARLSDVVILCLGLDSSLEGEQQDTGNRVAGGDKSSLELPKSQRVLLDAVSAVGKPVILVLNTGSPMDLRQADGKCNAILQCWYSGARGGEALAKILFGECSPTAKLPVTFYGGDEDLPDITDYSMQNRTYRYFRKSSLYPFGYGLTYTDFIFSELHLEQEELRKGENLKGSIQVSNTGDYSCDAILQIYIRYEGVRENQPNHSLCFFKRVPVGSHSSKKVAFEINAHEFTIVDNEGERISPAGRFNLFAGDMQPDSRSEELTGKTCISAGVTVI